MEGVEVVGFLTRPVIWQPVSLQLAPQLRSTPCSTKEIKGK